ncbi:YkgJ family cysteine cluster protein [Methanoregula sp. UBA64]|uniref:YkgJ family cysteine cluster protein n=1 Tax=Methanoregula sp. UBA64 TaxID=1915554 RepID=UPI0025F86DA4|nr:YkgJ family cysteine cluster protein [Methanoregula sp. UBA64]
MAFDCEQCGECCSHLGLVHSIAKDHGNYEFVVFNRYTNESDLVTVDPDKHALYDDKSIFAKLPEACPFFRHQPGSEKAFCTVHLTRPDICRDYGCWRMLIVNRNGRRAGRIMFARYLCSEDPFVTTIFEKCIDPVKEPDDARWDELVIRVLTGHGYTVRK